MFDTKQLEYILAIVEEQSLSRAADRLFVSQSALSQQLKKLYDSGVPKLFHYSHGKMLLTDAGRLYVNAAKTILDICDETIHSMNDPSSIAYPPLRIALLDGIQKEFYKSVIPAFKQSYPQVRLDVRALKYADTLQLLRSNQLDIAIYGVENPKNVTEQAFPLRKEELVFVIPADTDYTSQLPICLNHIGTNRYRLQMSALKKWNLSPNVYAYLNDIHGSLELTKMGQCCTIAEKTLAMKKDGVRILPQSEDFLYQLCAFCSKDSRDSKPTQKMIGLLQSGFLKSSHSHASADHNISDMEYV